jgi:uncharacterized membrane protein
VKAVTEKLALLFTVTVLVLNYPLLAVANRGAVVAGIPVLYLYLFGVWAVVIVAVAVLARTRWDDED